MYTPFPKYSAEEIEEIGLENVEKELAAIDERRIKIMPVPEAKR